MAIQIKINQNAVEARVKTAWERGLYVLSNEILNDCNQYCKEDTGMLIASSLIHSRPQVGRLVWLTPYAKRQYWAIRTSLTPGRTWKWCETAKSKCRDKWKRIAEKGMRENL